MLKDKTVNQEDIELLLHDLEGISNDVSQYVLYLVKRQNLIEQVLLEDPSCQN